MGTYTISYTVSLSDYSSVLAVTRTNAFVQPIIDRCTPAEGLSISVLSPFDPPTYYYSGLILTYTTGANVFTSSDINCPIHPNYSCEVIDSLGAIISSDCSLDDGIGTLLAFD